VPPLRLRKANHLDEELVDLADRPHELIDVDRLCDVGVGVQLVALEDVFLRGGGGEHDHGDVAEVGVGLDLLEQLAAVVLGQIQVEQDQVGLGRVGVGAPLVQKVQTLLPSLAT
jgi:hypothetical protein